MAVLDDSEGDFIDTVVDNDNDKASTPHTEFKLSRIREAGARVSKVVENSAISSSSLSVTRTLNKFSRILGDDEDFEEEFQEVIL